MNERKIPIRRAAPEDAAEAARLLHDFNTEYSDFTPGVEVLTVNARQMLVEGEMTVLLGGEGPDGLALIRLRRSVWTGAPEAYLQELYVAPKRRRQGIGGALLEATIALAREAGAKSLDLGTAETDIAARALYESAGFSNREWEPDGPAMLFYEREL